MSKAKDKGSANRTNTSPSKKRAEREAQEKKRKKKNTLVIAAVLIAIVMVSMLALLQGNGTEPNDGSSNDDSQDDNNDGDAVYGRYGLLIDGNPTIIDIGSTSCIPCQQLQPVLSALGQKYNGQINIEFYDCWNTALGAEMATRYQCSVIPTLIFLDGYGNEVARLMGYNSQSVIEAKMSELGWI